MPIPSEKELIENAVHLGHRKEKWNPKMARHLYGVRKGIHIFDLSQTRKHLEDVCAALKKTARRGQDDPVCVHQAAEHSYDREDCRGP
jgi:small subunit ribosomal protein S2